MATDVTTTNSFNPADFIVDSGPSLYDLAAMSEDVYKNRGGMSFSWKSERKRGKHGFAAATYTWNSATNQLKRSSQKKPIRIVAFRGTDDDDDLIEDLFMAPSLNPQTVVKAVARLMKMYNMKSPAPAIIGNVLKALQKRGLVPKQAFNTIPPMQSKQALAYFDAANSSIAVDYVVGHSLGGALAKIVALKKGVKCYAFNAPQIRGLSGVGNQSARGRIENVNAKLDPVSTITKFLGAGSVGKETYIGTQKPPQFIPSQSQMFGPALASGLSSRYGQAAVDICVVAHCALHYHSIGTLKKAISRGRLSYVQPISNR